MAALSAALDAELAGVDRPGLSLRRRIRRLQALQRLQITQRLCRSLVGSRRVADVAELLKVAGVDAELAGIELVDQARAQRSTSVDGLGHHLCNGLSRVLSNLRRFLRADDSTSATDPSLHGGCWLAHRVRAGVGLDNLRLLRFLGHG